MEIIVIITKEVADESEAHDFAAKVRSFVKDSPVLSDSSVRVQMETRDRIDPE